MSDLTPEAARAAAEWLDANNLGYGNVRGALHAEADRLEAASEAHRRSRVAKPGNRPSRS